MNLRAVLSRSALVLALAVPTLVLVPGIETAHAHPFIRGLVYAFVAFAPLALVGIAFFGTEFARWAT